MAYTPEFLSKHRKAALAIVRAGGVKEPLFARGAYHIEVQEKGKKKVFVFFQMQDRGELRDAFCTCKESEDGQGCVHQAAAYLQVFNGTGEPLHVRFKKSLWNRLFQMEAKRQGTKPDCLIAQKGGVYECLSPTQKVTFSIQPTTVTAKKRFLDIIAEKHVKTEETSIHFSNLSEEEIQQYRKGQAGHLLRYELSFWSDLAQWLMALQEAKKTYKIRFDEGGVPHEMEVVFPEVKLHFYISDVQWPWIIPALNTVESPLKVIEDQDSTLESVVYDAKARALEIKHRTQIVESVQEGISVGEWLYLPGKGFYRHSTSILATANRIEEAQIADVLSHSARELQKFLPIQLEPIRAQYTLHFDAEANLHLHMYLREIGDLEGAEITCFPPWIYIPEQGFFHVEEWLFPAVRKVLPKTQVSDFINTHRVWLGTFPGFQIHVGNLESRLNYQLSDEGELFFDVELSFPLEAVLDFDEWIYIRGQGFYLKKDAGRFSLHPGMRVPAFEIPAFIRNHQEELEQIPKFFSHLLPIEQMGLSIALNAEGLIVVTPKMHYAPNVDPAQIRFFGTYTFQEGQGFAPLPVAFHIPEKYQQTVTIPASQEAAFLAYELPALKAYVVNLDSRIEAPTTLHLKIRRITKDTRSRTQQWFVDLAYESNLGFTEIFPIWDAIFEKKRYLFSDAGLLIVKDMRFNWIRQLPKKRLDRKKRLIRLNTLEWIRLMAFEELRPPKGDDPNAVETRRVFEELSSFETTRALDLSGLKSTLRPYQEQGVHWLWFLYCHGLSGLLCDDMGLGKTHQAMALLAGICNTDPDRNHKYLVVCPTSVIYHWQELLKKFFPDLRICTYYGMSRSLEKFETDYDLVLTSYGVLRLGKEELSSYVFEVAFFDEIQVAKNYASQTHQALSLLDVKMRVGLTGTPIENRLREIKSLFDVVLPSYMPSDAVFRELFVRPIEKENDLEKKVLLHRLIKPFILRRKKSEVLKDLPEKIEEISYCDLSDDQRALYKQVTEQMKETVYRELQDTGRPVPYIHVFAALTKLKQICDHPALVEKDAKNKTSGKWDLFVELLEEALESGQKVVVFSQYLEMLEIVEKYLKKKGIGYASIKGSTRDRNEQLRTFREDPKCMIFVASLLAAGVGIDLTVASIVIHYDRWWNPAKENQATDRVHRIGQSRGVQVFKLVTKNTIEEHIHDLIERKKGLLEQIVGSDDQIQYLSREELLQVFAKMYSGS
jgi:superfamily II DNA or RNA helicase